MSVQTKKRDLSHWSKSGALGMGETVKVDVLVLAPETAPLAQYETPELMQSHF